MSTSVAFNVDAKVTQEWQRAIKHDKPFRSIHLQFKGETLHLINTHPSSSSYVKDFEGLREKVAEGEGCYVLLRIDDTNSWNCVSYVPEETSISTQEKMMYAVSKSPLKAKLGNGYFLEDWHVNSKKTFTFINYKNDTTPKKEASLSEAEKLLRNGLQEEETERTRQLSDPNLKGKSGLNQGAGSFDSNTQRELQKFKGGEVSFVHLGIDATEKLCLEDSKRVSTADDIRSSLAPGVPGFYLLSRSGSNVFLYCCPEKSPKNTRLVYATRMKSVRENITALGIRIAKYVEIQDPKDFESKVNDRPVNTFERETPAPKATQSAKVVAPHPLFGSGGGAMKKKVVIPPPGAW